MAKKANPEAMKWPTDKAKYDKNYLRLFGKKCPVCKGEMFIWDYPPKYNVPELELCYKCNGLGYVKKEKL